MSIEQANEDRRRHFRWRASGPDGWIAPSHKISLRDISRGGALIEHSHLVRPGTHLFMTLLVSLSVCVFMSVCMCVSQCVWVCLSVGLYMPRTFPR